MEGRLEELKKVVLEAGKILKRGFSSKKEIHHKGVVDLVTQYDIETEKFLKERISTIFPRHTIVAEESSDDISGGGYELEKAIYIDPIDGTTNFIHGIPHFSISIGIWEMGRGVAGIVYDPILNELYCALSGKGAYRNGKAISVSSCNKLQNALVATGFPYSKTEMGDSYHWVVDTIGEMLPHIQDIRRLGSAALDLCYLAEGRYDGFYEIELKPWDVAAGIVILEEAGGEVSNLYGYRYIFGNCGIVASNGWVHREMLEKIAKNEYNCNT